MEFFRGLLLSILLSGESFQVISSSYDRSVIIWSPSMDEQKPDQISEKIIQLQEDNWSDED
ncbi:unnamed protein product [Gongylonema pulchrum]|uniref:WD_REPEATS_REGION domain-containing protein n=1 Tax=Gongylonema pulchrum TaxID=637853 RepID=A0A183CW86_9BILA|nr:unnamed protein product [Gongylonema pulchrum]